MCLKKQAREELGIGMAKTGDEAETIEHLPEVKAIV
jgi:hypothetical protein